MKRSSWRFGAALLMLSATLFAYKFGGQRLPDSLDRPLDAIPLQIREWSGVPTPRLSDRVETALAATAYLSRIYRHNHREMSLLVTYYAQQRAGESMHSPQNCLPGAGWEAWDYKVVTVPVGAKNVPVNLYSIQKDGERMQVLYWYQSRNRIFANEYAGKLYLVQDALLDGRTGGALVRLMMPDRPDSVDEEIRFASRIIPEVQQSLGR